MSRQIIDEETDEWRRHDGIKDTLPEIEYSYKKKIQSWRSQFLYIQIVKVRLEILKSEGVEIV